MSPSTVPSVDYTPETPQHVPPSEEVQEAEAIAAHRNRVKRAKFKMNATWWGLGLMFYSTMVVLVLTEIYWLMPMTFTIPIWLMIRTNTKGMDDVYGEAFRLGHVIGSLSTVAFTQHAMWHAANGEEPCQENHREVVKVPHVWEHDLADEEVRKVFGAVPDDDDDDDDDDSTRS